MVESMQAQVLVAAGPVENFRMAEVPVPALRPGHVLIKVAATSVNPIDLKIREGLPVGPGLPATIGCDVAGTVVAVGEGVDRFQAGDEVYGCAGGFKGMGGALAQYLLADADLLAAKPRSLAMRDAAALPLVGITAAEALERSQVRAGERVLVLGAGGGVGHIALQLALAAGAQVVAGVRSDAAAQRARDLGATEILQAPDPQELQALGDRLSGGAGFDVVLDTVGGRSLDTAFALAARHGRVAAIAARSTHDLSPLHAKGLSLHVVFMPLPLLHGTGRAGHGATLQRLAALVDAGRLRPVVDSRRFALADAPQAHAYLASGQAQGKVVVEIAGAAEAA